MPLSRQASLSSTRMSTMGQGCSCGSASLSATGQFAIFPPSMWLEVGLAALTRELPVLPLMRPAFVSAVPGAGTIDANSLFSCYRQVARQAAVPASLARDPSNFLDELH